MTENEAKFEELKDAVCRLVCIAEDAICREGFEELDNAGVEIITCLDELEQYRAIGTIEEFKALKDENKNVLLKDGQLLYQQGIVDGYDKAIEEFEALKEKMQVIQIILEDMKCQIGASGEYMDKRLSEWIDKLKG